MCPGAKTGCDCRTIRHTVSQPATYLQGPRSRGRKDACRLWVRRRCATLAFNLARVKLTLPPSLPGHTIHLVRGAAPAVTPTTPAAPAPTAPASPAAPAGMGGMGQFPGLGGMGGLGGLGGLGAMGGMGGTPGGMPGGMAGMQQQMQQQMMQVRCCQCGLFLIAVPPPYHSDLGAGLRDCALHTEPRNDAEHAQLASYAGPAQLARHNAIYDREQSTVASTDAE